MGGSAVSRVSSNGKKNEDSKTDASKDGANLSVLHWTNVGHHSLLHWLWSPLGSSRPPKVLISFRVNTDGMTDAIKQMSMEETAI